MRIAADTVDSSQSKGKRVGQRLARPATVAPGKWIHGFVDGADSTLCGLPLDGLHVDEFPGWDFDAVAGVTKCRDCIAAAAGEPTAG